MDPDRNVSKSVIYLSPMKIYEEQHTFSVVDNHDSLKGLDPAERRRAQELRSRSE